MLHYGKKGATFFVMTNTTKTLYALRNLVYLPIEEGEEQYYGYGDYAKTAIETKGYVFATSKRKAGGWFKRELKKAWEGRKPFLNETSACPQFWVSEVDAEELKKLKSDVPEDANGVHVKLTDWFSAA